VNLQSLICSAGTHLPQIIIRAAAERFEVTDQDGIRLQRGGVIDEFFRIPVECADGEIIDAKSYIAVL
jgi:hypothetical protein